ncbi:MAG TPA: glycosyltransferase family 4 protein [Kiritimatiellia bacterium]|nr:glycosyltransferase family 4 protein [Kiritimatiellia bacterium]
MKSLRKIAVLHAACHPVTGPWSVMRDLARAQQASAAYAGVGLAVIVDSTWPAAYREEVNNLAMPFYEAPLPKTIGTAAFLYQRLRPAPWAQWIGDLAARTGADAVVVHLHNAWMSGVFLPLPEVPDVRTGVVATFHGVNEHFHGKPIRRALHRWMARRLPRHGARLTSVDAQNTRHAEEIFGIPRDAFAIIPNGIDPMATEPSPRAVADSAAPLVVGHVGSMIPQKGWQLLAEAAERVNRDGIRIRVVLAGQGPDADVAAAWAARHPDWAEFLGHVASPRENLMPRLDLLCLMSQWEGLPMSIIEAMSVGLPVVATDVGGVAEAVTEGETGVLIPRTVEALAVTLERLHRDRAELVRWGGRARRDFFERFTLARVDERYRAVYEESIA